MGVNVADLRVRFSAETSAAEKGIDSLNNKLNNVGKGASDGLNSFGNNLRNSLNSIGDSLTSAGQAWSNSITQPLVGLAKTALNSAAGFETSMNQIQAVTGATAAQMKVMQDEAIELGAKTVFSAGEAAQGMLELSKSGFTAQQSIEAMPGVLDLAAAGGLSIARASEIASNAINAFHLKASQAAEVSNVLAAAANASSIEVSDMSNSFAMASAVFATYGFNIYDLSTAIALLGNNGIKGSDAGTSLKTMASRLAAPTEKAAKLMKHLGVEVYDAAGNMRDFWPIMQSVEKAMQGLTEKDRNKAMYTIFGSDALRAASILLKEGDEGWNNMSEATHKSGQAALLADARMKGLAGAIEYWKGSVDSLLITAALPFQDFLSSTIRKAADLVTSFSKLDSSTQRWILVTGGAAAALGPLLIGLGSLAKATAFLLPMLPAIGLVTLALGGLYAAYKLNLFGMGDWVRNGINRVKTAAPLAARALDELWQHFTDANSNVIVGTTGINDFVTALTGSKQAGRDAATWVSELSAKIGGAQRAFEMAGGGINGYAAALSKLTGQNIKIDLTPNVVKLTWGDIFDFSAGFDPGDWKKGFVKLKWNDLFDFSAGIDFGDWSKGFVKLKVGDVFDFSQDWTKGITKLKIANLVDLDSSGEKTHLKLGNWFDWDKTGGKIHVNIGDFYDATSTPEGLQHIKFGDYYQWDKGKEKIHIPDFYELDENTGKEKINFGSWYEWDTGKEKIHIPDFYELDEAAGKETLKFGDWFEWDKTAGINLNLKDLFPKKIDLTDLFDFLKPIELPELKIEGLSKEELFAKSMSGVKWPEPSKFEFPKLTVIWPDPPAIVWPETPAWITSLLNWKPSAPAWITSLTSALNPTSQNLSAVAVTGANGGNWKPPTPTWIDSLAAWKPTTPEWLASLTGWVPSTPSWLDSLLSWTPAIPGWVSTLTSWIPATPTWVATLTSWIPATPAWLSSLLNWSPPSISLPSFFGGGGTTSSSAYTSSGSIGHKASGTNNFEGGWTWVGERGPELMKLPGGTQIMSNQKSMSYIANNASGNTDIPAPGASLTFLRAPLDKIASNTSASPFGTPLTTLLVPLEKIAKATTDTSNVVVRNKVFLPSADLRMPADPLTVAHGGKGLPMTLEAQKYNPIEHLKAIAKSTAATAINSKVTANHALKQPLSDAALSAARAKAAAAQVGKPANAQFASMLKSNQEMGREIAKSFDGTVEEFKSFLQSVPGLFKASTVTQADMDATKAGTYKDKADEWLRRLTDEVLNGVNWDGVDIKDAAIRAGLDPSLPAKTILDMVTAQWNDQSFFADKKNLELFNLDAVKEAMAQQAAQKAGAANILALFGIEPEAATAQAKALGSKNRDDYLSGLTGASGTKDKAGKTGQSLDLLSGMLSSTSITPESIAPLAQQFMSVFAAALAPQKDKDGKNIGVDFGAPIVAAIGTSLAESFKSIGDTVDFIGGITTAMNTQLLTSGAIEAVKGIGGKIGQLLKEGIAEYFRTTDLAAAVGSGLPTGTPKTEIGANAGGTNYWKGGLSWAHENGGEIMDLPRGTRVYPHDVSMEMAKNGNRGGDTYHVTMNNTVESKLDEEALLYRLLDKLKKRSR